MDVRCERCKTEYEFDDARITEAGVTVKCTTCEHVFRVKKKALVVTVPVKPGEVDPSKVGPPPLARTATGVELPAVVAPPTEKREWKLRQASGNVLLFKELTTLQKWIVEHRVVRDDAISLTGEKWKRLGDIAELSPFFEVVEQAQRVKDLEAQLAVQELMPLPAVDELPPQLVTPPPPPAVTPPPPPAAETARSAASARATDRYAARSAERRDVQDSSKAKGGAGKWIAALVLLGVLGAGGFFGYQQLWLPKQKAAEVVVMPIAVTPPVAEPAPIKEEVAETPSAPVPAPAEVAAVENAPEPAAVPAPMAAAPEVVPAAAPAEPAAAPPRVTPEGLVKQGDRLRMRDRPKQALASYDRALELRPESAEAMAGRGLALHDLGRNAEAESAFREALKVDPRYAVAVMGLAETYRHQGKRQDAVEQYQRYLEILPNGPEAPVAKSAIDRLKE